MRDRQETEHGVSHIKQGRKRDTARDSPFSERLWEQHYPVLPGPQGDWSTGGDLQLSHETGLSGQRATRTRRHLTRAGEPAPNLPGTDSEGPLGPALGPTRRMPPRLAAGCGSF